MCRPIMRQTFAPPKPLGNSPLLPHRLAPPPCIALSRCGGGAGVGAHGCEGRGVVGGASEGVRARGATG